MARVVVVGSINMDLVTLASRFAGPGETLLGDRFLTSHGGKGANQAVAAARLGARVSLVGAVGDDAFGEQLCEGLRREGVGLEHVTTVADCASGTASIAVAGGENQIIIVPAANLRVTPDHVERAQADIADADAVLVQMEIPLDTVETTVRLGHRLGTPVILNPAPARPLPANWLKLVTYATPNEHELAILLGAQDHREDTAEDFLALMRRAPCPLVLTHGAEGAWYRQTGEPQHQSSFKVDVIDSTGAGDTFNAALAVFLHEGLPQAVRKACAAAALSVAKLGAQGGMPRVSELDAFLAQQS